MHARARRELTPRAVRVATLQTVRECSVRLAYVVTLKLRELRGLSERTVKQARRPSTRALPVVRHTRPDGRRSQTLTLRAVPLPVLRTRSVKRTTLPPCTRL